MKLELMNLDITESGSLRDFLDNLTEKGVPVKDGRCFSTWLEATIEGLQDTASRAVQDMRDYMDEHPATKPTPQPEASTFYHATKDAAEKVKTQLLLDPRIAAATIQLEPGNGWLVVIVPRNHDLSDLADLAEIQDGRKNLKPNGKVPISQAMSGPDNGKLKAGHGGGEGGPASAPTKGATARVWVIASSIPGGDRAAIIAACVAEGINAATAATQYSKWKKARI